MTNDTPRPRGRTRNGGAITIGLTADLFNRLEQDARSRGLTRADVIRFALSEHLCRTRRTEDAPAPYRTD